MRVLVALLFAACAFAQTAQITGVLTDPTKAAVPQARITAVNAATGAARETQSNPEGYYTVPFLPPGRYELRVQAAGFKPVRQADIKLEVDQVVRLDFVLEVGSLAESVEIRATAPLLDTSTGALGQVIESRQFSDLPLNNRSALGLLVLSNGVVAGRGFAGDVYNAANLFSANGSRPGQNEILLDGAPNTVPGVWPGRGILGTPVSVDSVQEFKVQTNAFSAEFGRTGGGLVNIVSRSGTNDYHGSLFDYLRNSRLDSNNFFNNRNRIPLTAFRRNQFGGTAGGPASIPKLYSGRNRTLFFASYQGTRARTAESRSATVPSDAQRAGDFSSVQTTAGQSVLLYDPLTTTDVGGNPMRQPFAGNRLPRERINPVGGKLASFYPQPNRPGSVNNLAQAGSRRDTIDLFGLRLDQYISSRHVLNGRYNLTRNDYETPDWWGSAARGGTGQQQDVASAALDYVCTLRPTMVLNLRYGFSDRSQITNIDPALGLDLTALGFPKYIQDASQARVFPGLDVSGYAAMGNGEGRNDFSYIVHSTQQSLALTTGAHLLKTGADFRRHRVVHNRGIAASGAYSFSRAFTQGPNANRTSATAGDAVASLLLGTPASGSFGSVILADSFNPYAGFYLQDDWKLTGRLTLNLGLRYELEWPRQEAQDRLDWFDYDVVSPLASAVTGLGPFRGGLRFAGVDGNPRRHFHTDTNNFAPRLAFAWQATPGTTIRGGYGIFYGSGSIGAGGFNVASQGFAPSTDFVGSLDGLRPLHTLSNPFPDGFNKAVGNSQGLLSLVGQSVARVYDRDAPLPYNQQWNLSVQRQFGGVVLQVAYSGSRGIHLSDGAGYLINQLPPDALRYGSTLQDLRPNPFFGIITNPGALRAATVRRGQLLRPYPHFDALTVFNPTGAASTYHGGSLRAERRFASGVGFLASYTFSKNISDAPATVGPGVAHQDAYNRRADRSVAEEDIPHRLVASASWELPIGRGRRLGTNWNSLANAVFGGWQMNAILIRQSGPPLAMTVSPNNSGALGGRQRPNSRGFSARKSGDVQSRLDAFFDVTAFTAPEPFTYGNSGRNLSDVRGPGLVNLDFSLFKTFALGERARLQFRAEAFNASNTPVFALPNQTLGNLAFGSISSQQNDPRQVQLALKLNF